MPRTDAALVDVPAAEMIEDGVTFTAYFADQEPTGNSRDLTTFRYRCEAAHGGPYCERHARRAYLQRAA
jgi:hypothetical protein